MATPSVQAVGIRPENEAIRTVLRSSSSLLWYPLSLITHLTPASPLPSYRIDGVCVIERSFHCLEAKLSRRPPSNFVWHAFTRPLVSRYIL